MHGERDKRSLMRGQMTFARLIGPLNLSGLTMLLEDPKGLARPYLIGLPLRTQP